MNVARTEKTACILCSRNCGLEVSTNERQFVRIHGDEQHPVSKGYMCQKGARLGFYQDNADRLTHRCGACRTARSSAPPGSRPSATSRRAS